MAQWRSHSTVPKASPWLHCNMGIDNRDWFRDRIRKQTGYVERAKFRVPDSELRKKPFTLHIVWWVLGGFFGSLLAFVVLSKL
jgi:hypothetical protein